MSFMTDDQPEPIRRRHASPEAQAGREAAELVRELNRQLGLWQATSVKLHTIATRLKASGRHDPSVAEDVYTLFRVVAAEAERFEGMLPAQRPTVAGHSRINDTRRSFEMVADRLRGSLELLGIKADGIEPLGAEPEVE